jgi:hypothetical protein
MHHSRHPSLALPSPSLTRPLTPEVILAPVPPPVDAASLITTHMDLTALSSFLNALQAGQTALLERVTNLEASQRVTSFNQRAMEKDVGAVQRELTANLQTMGELRVQLGKVVKGTTESLPGSLESQYVKRSDLPCTKTEFEDTKLKVLDLVSRSTARTSASTMVEQQVSESQKELAELKASVAEQALAQQEMQRTMREIKEVLRRKIVEGEQAKLQAMNSTDPDAELSSTSNSSSQAAPESVTGVKPGETASALMELGKKKIKQNPLGLPTAAANSIGPASTGTAASDSSSSFSLLESQLNALSTLVFHLQSDLGTVQKQAKDGEKEVRELREGFAKVHAEMPIPFVAPSPTSFQEREARHEQEQRPSSSSSPLKPTLIAVSLHCDLCTTNLAAMLCVHCAAGSQKLCASCDTMVHLPSTLLAPGASSNGKDLPLHPRAPSPSLALTSKRSGSPAPLGGGSAMRPSSKEGLRPAGSAKGQRPSMMAGQAAKPTAGPAADLSKHLRLEISKTIQPGSKLLTSDLGYLSNQNESYAQRQATQSLARVSAAMNDLSERVDRHDLQFSSLAVSLNTMDESEAKLLGLVKDVQALRTKQAEGERKEREQQSTLNMLRDRLEAMAAHSQAGDGKRSPHVALATLSTTPSLADMSAVSTTSNPIAASLAKQLHSELDAHKQQTSFAILDLIQRLETFQAVSIDSLTNQVQQLGRTKIDQKQYLALAERVITLESTTRALGNSQTFLSQQSEDRERHSEERMKEWTCQHCDTGSLATGGNCIECERRICLNCSKVGRNGHTSELRLARGGGGGVQLNLYGTDDSSNGGGHSALSASALHNVLDASPTILNIQSRLHHLYDERDGTREIVVKQQRELEALTEMLVELDLLLHNHPPASSIEQATVLWNQPPFKFGRSADLLRNPHTLEYYNLLGDFFRSTLPSIHHRLGLSDQRNEVFSDSLAKLERRNREFEVASRPYVEERFSTLSQQVGGIEKACRRALRVELKKWEETFLEKQEKSKEEEKVGLESSLVRAHFRCVACDQPVQAQPGPLSKEYATQLAMHNQIVHGIGPAGAGSANQQIVSPQLLHGMSTVGGFATPLPPNQSSSAHTSSASALLQQQNGPTASSLGVISTERGHMYVDPGQRTTIHSNFDGTVYRGREDTRISFIPAAPTASTSNPSQPQIFSATFSTAYKKDVVVPSGSTGRSVTGAPRRKAGQGVASRRHPSAAMIAADANFYPAHTQPAHSLPQLSLSGSVSARTAAEERRPQTMAIGRTAPREEQKYE